MEEEVLTAWVRLRGADRERAILMKEREKRSYASLLRIALDHYYASFYELTDEAMVG
jgi:hypothetical protein